MKREIMEGSGLGMYAEVGIVIFVFVFILILARVFFMKKKEATHCADIPLEDDLPVNEASLQTESEHGAGHKEA